MENNRVIYANGLAMTVAEFEAAYAAHLATNARKDEARRARVAHGEYLRWNEQPMVPGATLTQSTWTGTGWRLQTATVSSDGMSIDNVTETIHYSDSI